jgi:hypothetical protein
MARNSGRRPSARDKNVLEGSTRMCGIRAVCPTSPKIPEEWRQVTSEHRHSNGGVRKCVRVFMASCSRRHGIEARACRFGIGDANCRASDSGLRVIAGGGEAVAVHSISTTERAAPVMSMRVDSACLQGGSQNVVHARTPFLDCGFCLGG